MKRIEIKIFVSLLIFIFIWAGLYIINNKKHLKTVEGTVLKNSHCSTEICHTQVGYIIDDISYTKTIDTGNLYYQHNDTISLYYNPRDHTDVHIEPIDDWLGWVLVIVSGLCLSLIWVGDDLMEFIV